MTPDTKKPKIHNPKLLVVAVIVIVGLIVWVALFRNNGTSNKTDYPSNQWQTLKLSSENLSFKIPKSWTISEDSSDSSKPPQNIAVLSPSTKNYYFSMEVSSGAKEDVYKNFLGPGIGLNLLNLNTAGSKTPLYLVAKGSKNAVAGLSLATKPGDGITSFGIIDKSGGSNNITMSVNLVTSPPTATPQTYSLKTYQAQPQYNNVLNIFKSLSFSHAH